MQSSLLPNKKSTEGLSGRLKRRVGVIETTRLRHLRDSFEASEKHVGDIEKKRRRHLERDTAKWHRQRHGGGTRDERNPKLQKMTNENQTSLKCLFRNSCKRTACIANTKPCNINEKGFGCTAQSSITPWKVLGGFRCRISILAASRRLRERWLRNLLTVQIISTGALIVSVLMAECPEAWWVTILSRWSWSWYERA